MAFSFGAYGCILGYNYHPLHVVSYPLDHIHEELSFTEEPKAILDRQDRARLASYKLEGDALNWWKAFKQAKEGLSNKRMRGSTTRFVKEMERPVILDGIVNTEFTDVAQVANAARNIEILRERSSHNNKRNCDEDRIRPTAQDINQRGYDQKGYDGQKYNWSSQVIQVWKGYSDYASPPCDTCGKLHPGKACHRVTGACFTCGSTSIWQGIALRMVETVVREIGTTINLLLRGEYFLRPRIRHLTLQFRSCPLRFDDKIRFANLLPLEMSDFDIILGMDWLTEHSRYKSMPTCDLLLSSLGVLVLVILHLDSLRYSVLLVRTPHDLILIRLATSIHLIFADFSFGLIFLYLLLKSLSELFELVMKMVGTRGSTPEFSGPAFETAVQRAVDALLPSLTTRLTNEIRQNGAGGSGYQPPTIHTWLERLASYKLEGDALNWWKAFKQAKRGETSEQQKYERGYHTIRQRDEETSGELMKWFLRLAGFVGKKAGPSEEQAKHFKWALCDWILDGIVNTKFTDVAQVANAARNIKILRERSGQNNKRNRDRDRIRPTTQDSNQRGYDQKGYDGRSYDRQGGNSNQKSWQNRGLLELVSLVVRLGIWPGIALRMVETMVGEIGTTINLLLKGEYFLRPRIRQLTL
ncbi:hypothetical protein Tco_0866570 [Tanacetum coccineum]